MTDLPRKRSGPPYAVGALIGILSWFAFATVDRPLGITTAFEYSAALLTEAVSPEVALTNSYCVAPEESPKIDWEWMLVAGDRSSEAVPELWRQPFGEAPPHDWLPRFWADPS